MRRRSVPALLALLFLAACTNVDDAGSGPVETSVAPAPPSPETPPPAAGGPDSAPAAAKRLCEVPEPGVDGGAAVPAEGPTPAVIASVMRQIERIRGFGYTERVVAQAVPQAEIAADIVEYADTAYPQAQFARRSAAWETIGVIPDGTSLRDAYESYGSTQVIGYYDTITGRLKFTGSRSPSPLERVTLAHELTHAIDDQRFGLEKLDALGAECRDEDSAAALALVEGNATFFMLRWAQTFLTPEQQVQVGIEAATQDVSTEGIPPFVVRLQAWPYEQGMRFVAALEDRSGLDGIDGAFERLPTSTEQIIHPERYPNDVPTPVDVTDLSAELGDGWRDLDVMSVGESWLQIALGLRLDASQAMAATSGWDGGTYRAWTDGSETAVVLSTVWDSAVDAAEFAGAMRDWIAAGDDHGEVLTAQGEAVTVLFASSGTALEALRVANA